MHKLFSKCVYLKGIEGCWECDELEACDNFEFLKPFHGNAPWNSIEKSKNIAWITGLSTKRVYIHGYKAPLRLVLSNPLHVEKPF
jgi:hypothetical protein